jgi:hypothetical protein
MSIIYTKVNTGEREFITVFPTGGDPLVAGDEHPNYGAICDAIDSDADPAYLADLFSVEKAIAKRFVRLSERVSVANGRVYFDGDEADDSVTKQIIRFLDEQVADWLPLVAFMENVAANPTDHSRAQLYDWLKAHDFTITSSGHILGYKGVVREADGSLRSGSSGHAIVNGKPIVGHIPNEVGAVVEMPRSSVAWDPSEACSTGLHVGTYRYAQGFAKGAMLQVAVNPRDVVSVPTDARGEKVRVCRYVVRAVINAPVESPLYVDIDDDDFEPCSCDYDEFESCPECE